MAATVDSVRRVAGVADILARPMKQEFRHAPSLRDFSRLPASPRSALPASGRSVVIRAEVGLSARLERTIVGESFRAHVNLHRLEGLRQRVATARSRSPSFARAR